MMNADTIGLRVEGERIWVLDQRMLPDQEVWNEVINPGEMITAIKELQIRGAPLLGVGAAFSLGQMAAKGRSLSELRDAAKSLRQARPTAVNLMNAIDRFEALFSKDGDSRAVQKLAQDIFEEDVKLCQKMAEHGQSFIENGDRVLTHCNSGALATAGIGTALGVLRFAVQSGKKIHVYADETRPLLQGARLTAWECEKFEIPYTLICDNMAASLMGQGKISKAITGADRIARNGDFANKIGTYSVAINCQFHQIPFAVAAPVTTVDPHCVSGKQIPIEDRHSQEVRGFFGHKGQVTWAPKNSQVENPAFDVTPAKLVRNWILDTGYFSQGDIHASNHWWLGL